MSDVPESAYENAPPQRWRTILGRLSFALGAVSCFICVFGIFAAIPAIVLGVIARMRQPRTGGRVPGVGAANAGIILGSVGGLLSVVLLFSVPYFFGVQASQNLATCQNNLKVIGFSLREYAAEHDGAMPDKLSMLDPEHASNDSLFICPASGNKAGDPARVDEWSDYILVPGLRVTGTSADATTLACYDRKHHERHGRQLGRNEAYVDGHVELRRLGKRHQASEPTQP